MSEMVGEVIGKAGQYRVGGVGFGPVKLGGKSYASVDEVMSAALPNAWRIANGPKEGMKLVQSPDGVVSEISEKLNAPANSVQVISLKEHCVAATRNIERNRRQSISPEIARQMEGVLPLEVSNGLGDVVFARSGSRTVSVGR